MSLRIVLLAGLLVVLVVVDVYLLATERIAPSEAQARHLAVREDPLLAMQFIAQNRQANLEAMGLDATTATKVTAQMTDLDQRYGDKIDLLLEQGADPTALSDALCGQTHQERPRYAALRVLVKEDKGLRSVVMIGRATELVLEEWAKVAPIQEVYAHAELAVDRPEDSTRMALAAVLLGQEAALLEDQSPWGRGLSGTWSWDRLRKENPGIDARVHDYLALMHVVVEHATAEGGICGE